MGTSSVDIVRGHASADFDRPGEDPCSMGHGRLWPFGRRVGRHDRTGGTAGPGRATGQPRALRGGPRVPLPRVGARLMPTIPNLKELSNLICLGGVITE